MGAFGKEFAKSKEVDPKHHQALLSAFDLRQSADYDFAGGVAMEIVEQAYARGEAFVAMARERLTG